MPQVLVRLEDVQPSQLYVNAELLAEALAAWDPLTELGPPPLRVADIDGVTVLVEDHAVAVSLAVRGSRNMLVYRNDEPLDLDVIQKRVMWCREEGVRRVDDLLKRVVPPDEFETRWTSRVRE
jgi:hypothetical protein